ncbi:MAG: DNA repair protein RecO C-terminal domain-containing protein, partial [Pseudomonadota bacterium]
LFALYQSVLADLLNKDLLIEQTLRRFEKYLLEVCGYGLLLDGEADSHEAIEADRLYFYHLEHGPGREKIAVDDIPVSGQTLLSFSADEALGPDQLQQTKRLMRAVLRHYLGDKPLASRALFEQQSS